MLRTQNNTLGDVKLNSRSLEAVVFHWTLVIIGSIALSLNALLCLMFIVFRKKLLKQPNKKILLSMIVADSFVGMTCIVFAGGLITKQSKDFYKLTGEIPLFGSKLASLVSLSAMTIDRLIAMKNPLRYRAVMSSSRVCRLVALCWTISAFLTILEACIYLKLSYKIELKLRGYMLVVFFSIGSIVVSMSNVILYRTICKHVKGMAFRLSGTREWQRIHSQSSVDETGCAEMMQNWRREFKQARSELKEIKAARLCIKMTLVFIISWLPLTTYRFSYSTDDRINIPWLCRFCLMMAICNSVINPIAYMLSRSNIQKYMWHFLTRSYQSHRQESYV